MHYNNKDKIMQMDLNFKSQQLLESLANSIHDRDKGSLNPFFFNISEVRLVEKWITELIREISEGV